MGQIRGKIVDDEGHALDGILVVFRTQGGDVADTVESFRGVIRSEKLPDGDYRWTASSSGFVEQSGDIKIAGGGTVPLAIVLPRAGSIAGTVLNSAGNPEAGRTVTAQNTATGTSAATITAADSAFRIPALTAGMYKVSVPGPDDPGLPPVAVAGGKQTDVNIVLPAPAVVVPVATIPVPTMPVVTAVPIPTEPPATPVATSPVSATFPAPPVPVVPVVVPPLSGNPSVESFLDTLDDVEFGVESPVNEAEANEAVVLFSVVSILLAGSSSVTIGGAALNDVLGVTRLYYGMQDKSVLEELQVASQELWPAIEADLKLLRDELEGLRSELPFVAKEAKRQFNLGRSTEAVGNTNFPTLFTRYVALASNPLLSLDLRAEDGPRSFTGKEKIGQAYALLADLKATILQLVRSLSKYGTIATRRANHSWAAFQQKALDILKRVGAARVTEDADDQSPWSVLAALTEKNRDTVISPYVVLAREGGQLLRLAMQVYLAARRDPGSALDSYDRDHLLNLFQPSGAAFLTVQMQAQASVVTRYPVPGWQ